MGSESCCRGKVLLTILVAAVATYMSPLKEPTGEILSRIKPNLYDLIIAFLAGIAGAGAICTRQYYITIVTGVAIATAVIPPLSVSGFGVGTMSFEIFSGGFLLFFTNLVAIIISTCIVFYFYDFRPSIYSHYERSRLKRRITFLAGILFIISIPLIYTLHKTIVEIRLRTAVQDALRHELDRERQSRLTRFSYSIANSGMLRINAIINTIEYLRNSDIRRIESDVSKSLGRKIRLDLEQIKVQSGGLREVTIPKPSPPVMPPPKPPLEIVRDLRETVMLVVRQSTEKVDKIISPARVTDFSAGFNDKSSALSILLKIRRDSPFSDTETLWLQRTMSDNLNLPVDLRIETVPFIPLLVFKPGDTAVTTEMRKNILSMKDIFALDPKAVIRVEAYEESKKTRKRALSVKRLNEITDILEKECNIPSERITASISNKRLPAPAVKITVLLSGQSG